MTVAHSQAKHLKSIPSPTKSQATASRAPTRLKSVVLRVHPQEAERFAASEFKGMSGAPKSR
jgi:hypothetical protein